MLRCGRASARVLAHVAYYALDPGAFYERFDPWLDRLMRYIFFPFIFTAYSLVLYFWCERRDAALARGGLARGMLTDRGTARWSQDATAPGRRAISARMPGAWMSWAASSTAPIVSRSAAVARLKSSRSWS